MANKINSLSNTQVNRNAKAALFEDGLYSHTIARISHDLKAPLSIVMMQLELMWLLLDNGDERLDPLIGTAMQNSIKLSRLINNFSDLLRIQLKCAECRIEKVDVVRYLREICEMAQRYADSKSIVIQFEAQCQIKYILTDIDKLERLILNLVSNAIKYTPENGFVKVTVKFRKRGVVIFVQDTGTGMPFDVESAFNKDLRADIGAALGEQAKGVGLAMVKAYVVMLGGNAYCRSENEKGSVFIVDLPEPRKKGVSQISRSLNSRTIIRQELSELVCKKDFN